MATVLLCVSGNSSTRIPAVSTMIATPQLPAHEWIQRRAERNSTEKKPKIPNDIVSSSRRPYAVKVR